MRYDINPLRARRHIASKIYRMPRHISQIPSGIYIAASHKWLAKSEFVFLDPLIFVCYYIR